MSKNKYALMPSEKIGWTQELVLRIKLILRLMGDRRVNLFLKLLPIASVVYLFLPVDLLPGITLPVIGALDDAAVLWMGASLFIALCPEDVVQEHLDKLQKVIPATWRDVPTKVELIETQPLKDEEQTEPPAR